MKGELDAWQTIGNVTFAAFWSHVTHIRDLTMKPSNYRFTQKRRIWGARLEILARRIERWLDENHEKAFFGFVMACLFLLQFLLFLR